VVIPLIDPGGSDAFYGHEKRRIVLISMAGSTIIGAIVGYGFKNYETVYTNTNISIDLLKVPFDLILTGNTVSLRLSYNF